MSGIIQITIRAIHATMKTSKSVHCIALTPLFLSPPEYLAAFIEREVAKWAAPIRASGITVD
jgi:hypothetical protein